MQVVIQDEDGASRQGTIVSRQDDVVAIIADGEIFLRSAEQVHPVQEETV